jgi:hypothetical protein
MVSGLPTRIRRRRLTSNISSNRAGCDIPDPWDRRERLCTSCIYPRQDHCRREWRLRLWAARLIGREAEDRGLSPGAKAKRDKSNRGTPWRRPRTLRLWQPITEIHLHAPALPREPLGNCRLPLLCLENLAQHIRPGFFAHQVRIHLAAVIIELVGFVIIRIFDQQIDGLGCALRGHDGVA